MKYDVIIIGGGPAGLTAAVYCLRRQLKTLVIAKAVGGQAVMAEQVENFPGQIAISGWELMQKMEKQAKEFGAEFIADEIAGLQSQSDIFSIVGINGSYEAKAVILAFGLTPKNLGAPGEEEFKGRGVSYCAICDGPLYKGKTVAVVGGGNSALEAAEYLSKIASQVYLVNRTGNFGGDMVLFDRLKNTKNVECYCLHRVIEVKGDNKIKSIILEAEDNKQVEVNIDGVFVEIGYEPKSGWVKGVVKQNERGEIITDKAGQTSVEGIFAAGDCTDVGFKQMVIACGEGAKAALSAYKFLTAKDGKVALPDWGRRK